MTHISAVVLTLNEEDYIEGCLKSIQWCDEIIIVDGYSEDSTIEIASRYADNIIQTKSKTNFDELRKIGVNQAEGEWILTIDADERIKKGLAESLLDISRGEQYDVVSIPRKNYFLGEWRSNAGWPDYVVRFFRPGEVVLGNKVHNFIDINPEARVKKLDPDPEIAIEHFSYLGIRDRLDRINRYTDIEADQVKKPEFFRLFLGPMKRFIAQFVLRKDYRWGIRGLIASIMDSFYVFLEELKCLERRRLGGEDQYISSYKRRDKELEFKT
ncbi:MAG: glycosyltransferase family 2 protein [Candidatus Nanohalobium sp.]